MSEPRATTKRKVFYLHTIDHRPAVYVPGEQICFLSGFGKWAVATLAKSLRQIRREQQASFRWRQENCGETAFKDCGYGYKKVRLP